MLKRKTNKKRIFILSSIIFIIVIIAKISSSLIFYKQEFNANVYDDLSTIHSYSLSVWISADEILSSEKITVEKINTITWNYEQILQSLQRLNSKAYRYSSFSGVNFANYIDLRSQLSSIRMKHLEESSSITLTEEEINTLIDIKNTFKNLADIVYKNIDGLDRTSLGVPDVLTDDLWLNIMKTIQLEHDKFR